MAPCAFDFQIYRRASGLTFPRPRELEDCAGRGSILLRPVDSRGRLSLHVLSILGALRFGLGAEYGYVAALTGRHLG